MIVLTIVSVLCGYYAYKCFSSGDLGSGVTLSILAVLFMIIRVCYRKSIKETPIPARHIKTPEEELKDASERVIMSLDNVSKSISAIANCLSADAAEDAVLDIEDDPCEAIAGSDEDEAFQNLNIETAIRQTEKRLAMLYNRKDKYEYINGETPEKLEAFKKTKAWRGLEWDIKDAEERLARLEKARG